jgi:hypothetical protein
MSNRAGSYGHGVKKSRKNNAKKKERLRANKARLREGQISRQEKIKEKIKAFYTVILKSS